jgi:hypothetical protein
MWGMAASFRRSIAWARADSRLACSLIEGKRAIEVLNPGFVGVGIGAANVLGEGTIKKLKILHDLDGRTRVGTCVGYGPLLISRPVPGPFFHGVLPNCGTEDRHEVGRQGSRITPKSLLGLKLGAARKEASHPAVAGPPRFAHPNI